ncbi:50S ribosomal protein L30e-like protein [Aspergillus heterothallicus]
MATSTTSPTPCSVNRLCRPLADEAQTEKLHDLLARASHPDIKLVKKGKNETTKAVDRGHAQLVIIAADADPLPVGLVMAQVCAARRTPYVWVRERRALGAACGVLRGTVSVAITKGATGQLAHDIRLVCANVPRLYKSKTDDTPMDGEWGSFDGGIFEVM